MYPVSKLFQNLMNMYMESSKYDSIYGKLSIRTATGISTFNFDESAIIQGSLSIKDQLGNGKFGFGGCYVRNMTVRIDCDKIEGLNAINVNLTNAEIELWYRLVYNNGNSHEDVYMGKFYIDSKNSSRKYQILKLIGEDSMSKLDVTAAAMSNASPYAIYEKACALAELTPFTTQAEMEAFPNGTMSLSFDTSQIQSARDMIMWVAKLTGTIARVKRCEEQGIELVQIPTKYTTFNIPGNFDYDAFVADNGSIIGKNVTFKTDYTDTSIRVLTLITDYKGERIIDGWHWTEDNPPAPDTLEGTMEIESNPLLNNTYLYAVKTALGELEDYTQHLRMCPFNIEFAGNPAIEIGDFVYLEKGGVIDDNFRHYGIVTYHRWVYKGKSEIRCEYGGASQRPVLVETQTQAQSETETEIAVEAAAAPMMLAVAAANTAEVTAESLSPKSQLEKRLGSTTNNGLPDRLVTYYPGEGKSEAMFSVFSNDVSIELRRDGDYVGKLSFGKDYSKKHDMIWVRTADGGYISSGEGRFKVYTPGYNGFAIEITDRRIYLSNNNGLRHYIGWSDDKGWVADDKKIMLEDG